MHLRSFSKLSFFVHCKFVVRDVNSIEKLYVSSIFIPSLILNGITPMKLVGYGN